MGFKFLVLFVIACASAQTYKVCLTSPSTSLCQSLDRDDSQAVCDAAESKVDCAIRLGRGTTDFGVFSEEEMLLLGHQQPNDNRVIATIRDVTRSDAQYAFEAVAVVSSTHTGGFESLRGGRYCHPGLDESNLRWSPRVLKSLERAIAGTDRCPHMNIDHKTADEMEVETLNGFFSQACRPGPWSSNDTVDARLKSQFPTLCELCGTNPTCAGYTLDMGVAVAGVSNDNRHIQTLECLRRNGNGTIALAAWHHVREYFNIRNPQDALSFALICEDGSMRPLTAEALAATTAPCSFVKQPWSAFVASSNSADRVLASMRTWWPNGANPGGNTWQSSLYSAVVEDTNARIFFLDSPVTPANYTNVRNVTSIDGSSSCFPARRWCTTSVLEQSKCSWLRTSAYTLGIEPTISCHQRATIFDCLRDIRDNSADLMATPANYGYISRQHFTLSAVKLVQNSRSNPAAFSRVAALVKETTAQSEITRFENLRGKKACFPEFGGIAYMAFVKAAHDNLVISATECDYARGVGEFFEGACAGGAVDTSHSLTASSSFNASTLCSVCRPAAGSISNFTCAWDYTNLYYGNNGSLACLTDSSTHVAFVEMQDIDAHLRSLNLEANQFRALCRNNTLASTAGTAIDQNCLLAYVVDSEVLSRRNDPVVNSLNVLLDTLDQYFGYNAGTVTQLINMKIYSPFDSTSDLLFKDTAIGLSEPSLDTTNEASKNYIELFKHLESCNAAAPLPSMAANNFYSIFNLFVIAVMARFVVY